MDSRPDSPVEGALRRILDSLHAKARSDPSFAAILRAVGQSLTDIGTVEQQPSTAPTTPEPTAPPVAQATSAPTAPAPPPPPPAPPTPKSEAVLRIAGLPVPVPVAGTTAEAQAASAAAPRKIIPDPTPPDPRASAGSDLALIARRARLKGQACRWVIDRRRFIRDGADRETYRTRDVEFYAKAKELNPCYLWMMDPHGPSLPDDELLENIAGCYETLATGVELALAMSAAGEDADFWEDLSPVLAQAQSAVRGGLLNIDRTLWDNDQRETFLWLRAQAEQRRVLIHRYMRLDDVASEKDWIAVQDKLAALRKDWEQGRQRDTQRQSLLAKARYHAKQCAKSPGQWSHDWTKLAEAIEELVSSGVPASDSEVREILLPLEEDRPEHEFGPGFSRVWEELDKYLSISDRPESTPKTRAPSPDVLAARELLRGKKIILIGGERRRNAEDALVEQLGLDEVIWLHQRPHTSIEEFQPAVARPDVSLVLLAIRWSSHSYGEVRSFCDQYAKPLVRLPAGYNPQQVAKQIVEQAAQRLAAVG